MIRNTNNWIIELYFKEHGLKATRFWGQLLHSRIIEFAIAWESNYCFFVLQFPSISSPHGIENAHFLLLFPNTLCTVFLSSSLRGENWGRMVHWKEKIDSQRSSTNQNWNNILQIVQGQSFEYSIHAVAFFQSHRKIKQQLWLWQSSKYQLRVAQKTTSVVAKHGWWGGGRVKDTWPNKNLWGATSGEKPPLRML